MIYVDFMVALFLLICSSRTSN